MILSCHTDITIEHGCNETTKVPHEDSASRQVHPEHPCAFPQVQRPLDIPNCGYKMLHVVCEWGKTRDKRLGIKVRIKTSTQNRYKPNKSEEVIGTIHKA